jgi:hypothetical protein
LIFSCSASYAALSGLPDPACSDVSWVDEGGMEVNVPVLVDVVDVDGAVAFGETPSTTVGLDFLAAMRDKIRKFWHVQQKKKGREGPYIIM